MYIFFEKLNKTIARYLSRAACLPCMTAKKGREMSVRDRVSTLSFLFCAQYAIRSRRYPLTVSYFSVCTAVLQYLMYALYRVHVALAVNIFPFLYSRICRSAKYEPLFCIRFPFSTNPRQYCVSFGATFGCICPKIYYYATTFTSLDFYSRRTNYYRMKYRTMMTHRWVSILQLYLVGTWVWVEQASISRWTSDWEIRTKYRRYAKMLYSQQSRFCMFIFFHREFVFSHDN